MDKPEALRLADALMTLFPSREDGERAAAELRQLHEANEAFGKRQEWWNERMFVLEQQRDALLEALKGIVAMWDHHCYAHGDGQPTPLHVKARAAIKAVEEGK